MSILYAWIFWEVASSVCWKIHCGVYSVHLLHKQWQQYLLPVSCFHFSVSLLHAWLFWKMTSLLCWKFTLVYRVQIHYAMATILVACVLQSLQNTTICTLPLQCPYVVLISKRSYLVNTPAVQCSVIDVNPIWLMHRHMSQICIDMNALF